jgi:hypothetical protein
MKTKKLLTAFAMALVVLIVACKKDTFKETVAVCPKVTSTDPSNGATNVPLNQVIRVSFNEAMNPATINQSSFSLFGATQIPGTVSYDQTTHTMIFVPGSPLVTRTAQAANINSTYTARVMSSVKDLMGNALQTDYVWTFSTSASLSPTVTSTDPVNNANGVAPNKIVTATFSEPMNPSTITSTTYTILQGATTIAGTVSYTGSTASFTPTSNFVIGKTYTATITIGAKDPAGFALNNNYVWIFTPGIDLKTVARFGIISGTGISNNAGFSVINNLDVGISPGVRSSVTGFPPATIVNGAIYASDDVAPPGVAAMLTQAKLDLTNAYLSAQGATMPAPAIVSGDQGGLTLTPGIYKTASTLLIQSGDLTLDAQGDTNAVWIFQIGSGFTTVGGAGGNVLLSGGAQAKNIYWQVGSTATIGDFTSFQGNIMALTSITMNSGAVAVGRMLAINGAVVMTSTNTISKP